MPQFSDLILTVNLIYVSPPLLLPNPLHWNISAKQTNYENDKLIKMALSDLNKTRKQQQTSIPIFTNKILCHPHPA